MIRNNELKVKNKNKNITSPLISDIHTKSTVASDYMNTNLVHIYFYNTDSALKCHREYGTVNILPLIVQITKMFFFKNAFLNEKKHKKSRSSTQQNTLSHQEFQLLMLKGTVALNYMNTNVVYFFQTQIQFCTIYSRSYKKNSQHIVPNT